MQFKTDELRGMWPAIDPKLREVLKLIDAFSVLCFEKEIVITSLIRPASEDSGRIDHSIGKAADIRTKHYNDEDLNNLERWLFLMDAGWLMDDDERPLLHIEPHKDWQKPDHPKYESRHLHVGVE
jgi:hypothetical protein